MTGNPAVRGVLATRNAKKVPEIQAILQEAGLGFELRGLDAYPDAPQAAETENTFTGNALLKARAVAAHTREVAFADDSGLCVDELGGMPGVLSARWSGRFGREWDDYDKANLALVLDQLADTPWHRRGARFVCVAVAVFPDGREYVAEGALHGRLATQPAGERGFGYDPIFVPEAETRTTAEMSAEEKNAISHRGAAFRELAAELRHL